MNSGKKNESTGGLSKRFMDIQFSLFPKTFTFGIHYDCPTSLMSYNWARQRQRGKRGQKCNITVNWSFILLLSMVVNSFYFYLQPARLNCLQTLLRTIYIHGCDIHYWLNFCQHFSIRVWTGLGCGQKKGVEQLQLNTVSNLYLDTETGLGYWRFNKGTRE